MHDVMMTALKAGVGTLVVILALIGYWGIRQRRRLRTAPPPDAQLSLPFEQGGTLNHERR